MNQIIDFLLFIILSFAALVMALVTGIDSFLAAAMTYAGVPSFLQLIALFIIAFWLIILAVRVFRPFLSTIVTLLLICLVLHRLFPTYQPPAPPLHTVQFIQSYI